LTFVAAGGTFANGAVTGAFSYLFNGRNLTGGQKDSIAADVESAAEDIGEAVGAEIVGLGPEDPVADVVAGERLVEAAEDAAKITKIVVKSATAKGLFGLGKGTSELSEKAGKAWVGEGARLSRSGRAWISKDGLRQYISCW
jgi:hypothetical protein